MPDDENTIEDENLEGESDAEEGDDSALDDAEDAGEDDGNDEIDQVAALKEQLESLKSQSVTKSDLNQLTAAVGRVQSLAAKLEKSGDVSGLQGQITEQFGDVYDILGPILDGLDETALSPEARAKANQARQAARDRAKEVELLDKLRKEIAPEPQGQPEPSGGVSPLETFIVETIKSQGLDDSDPRFDWNEATALGKSGGSPAVVKYFTDKILEIKTEDSAADRRETRRKRAGGESPKGGGGQRTPQEIVDAAYNGEEIPLADQIKALKELGVELHA